MGKGYAVTRKKENMRSVSKLKHNTYWIGYFVDHELNMWTADARWMCDGYLIERQGWYGNASYQVYTKWWWEKLTSKEKKETLKKLEWAINTMTKEWWTRVNDLIKKECNEVRNRINNAKIREVHEQMDQGTDLPYPCLCLQKSEVDEDWWKELIKEKKKGKYSGWKLTQYELKRRSFDQWPFRYFADKKGCIKNFKFLSEKMKRPRNIIKYELRKTPNGSYFHEYLENILANQEEDTPWNTWEDFFINEKKKITKEILNGETYKSRDHNWKGHEESYFMFSQVKTIKKTLEKTGKVVKVERSKEIKTLYGAVELIETLGSPYKRNQLKQIVYYRPKKWVQSFWLWGMSH